MKTYVLTIQYNEETEEVEYLTEEVITEDNAFYYGDVDVSEYWDEETLELLADGCIFGES